MGKKDIDWEHIGFIIYRQTNDMFLILKTEPGTKVV